MPSTTVHIPDELLERVDRLARRRRISRNRLVIEALSAEIERDAGAWPDEFFTRPDAQTVALLRQASCELESAVAGARRNRGAPLL